MVTMQTKQTATVTTLKTKFRQTRAAYVVKPDEGPWMVAVQQADTGAWMVGEYLAEPEWNGYTVVNIGPVNTFAVTTAGLLGLLRQ